MRSIPKCRYLTIDEAVEWLAGTTRSPTFSAELQPWHRHCPGSWERIRAFGLKFLPHTGRQFLTVTGGTAHDKAVAVCIVSGKDAAVAGIFFGQGIDGITQGNGIQFADEEKHVTGLFRGGQCIHLYLQKFRLQSIGAFFLLACILFDPDNGIGHFRLLCGQQRGNGPDGILFSV